MTHRLIDKLAHWRISKLAYWLLLPLLLWGGFHLFFYIDTQEEKRQVAKNKDRMRLSPTQLDSLQQGDIILRRGYGFCSDMISQRLNKGKFDVTHSGILYRRQGQWWVIHSLSSDVSETDGMQQQPLATFLNYSMPEKLLVVRPQGLTSEQGLKVVERALYYLQKGVPFDHRGVIDDPSELYCTELIYQILENDLHYLSFPQEKDQRKDAFYSMTTLYNPKYFRIVINTYKESKK